MVLQTAIEPPGKETTMLDRILTTEITPRVERLREALLRGKTGVSIDRARIETRTMKQTEGESMVTRRAKVFAAVAREMPIDISPDELIVGCFSGRPLCWNVSPADGPGAEKMLFTAHPRKGSPRLVGVFKENLWNASSFSDEQKRELKEELIPYWKGEGNYERTMSGRNYQQIRDTRNVHIGHNCVGYGEGAGEGLPGDKEGCRGKVKQN